MASRLVSTTSICLYLYWISGRSTGQHYIDLPVPLLDQWQVNRAALRSICLYLYWTVVDPNSVSTGCADGHNTDWSTHLFQLTPTNHIVRLAAVSTLFGPPPSPQCPARCSLYIHSTECLNKCHVRLAAVSTLFGPPPSPQCPARCSLYIHPAGCLNKCHVRLAAVSTLFGPPPSPQCPARCSLYIHPAGCLNKCLLPPQLSSNCNPSRLPARRNHYTPPSV
eukprot:COSAG01_NODE_2766_length_7109_cov_36.719686_3_plen_222_part_00